MRLFQRFLLLAAPCVLLGACRAPASSSDEPVDLAYEIHAPRAADGAVELILRIRAAPDGACTLVRDLGWGGTPQDDLDITGVEARGAGGRMLALEHPSPSTWSLRAEPGEELAISWRLPPNANLASATHNDHYRPIVTAEQFHVLGTLALFAPQHAQAAGPVAIRLSWHGFEERGWQSASSFGLASTLVVKRELEEFRQAVFLAGKFTLVKRELRGGTLAIALPSAGLAGDPDEFADLCAHIVHAQREFFDDWDYPFYLISALAAGKDDPHSLSLGGTGLTNSFALFVQRGADIGAASPLRPRVEHLLAHEMFHNWCGRLTPIADPERLCYWFSEGFTEFFTRRLLLRMQLESVDEFAASLQQSLHDYHKSPRRNASNQSIADDFWTDRAASEQPYRRGDLVATWIDHAIRTRTNGAQSLDDFMREAVALGRAGERIQVESLLARIERWTDAGFAAKVRAVLVDGATIELPSDVYAPCLAVETSDFPTYELGFDFEATRASKRITGVVAESAAWKAGLRDGQALRAFSDERRADKPVRVEVVVDEQPRSIEYLPAGRAEKLPCVRIVDRAGCSAL